jgi:hypothetical protein
VCARVCVVASVLNLCFCNTVVFAVAASSVHLKVNGVGPRVGCGMS